MEELKYKEITTDILKFMESDGRREFVLNSSKQANDVSQNMIQSLVVSPEVMKLRIGV